MRVSGIGLLVFLIISDLQDVLKENSIHIVFNPQNNHLKQKKL